MDFLDSTLTPPAAWSEVLGAYRRELQRAREANPEFDGWLSRIAVVEQVEPEAMSRIHGQLIALGLLKFDLSSRDAVLRYQLTRPAHQLLAGASADQVEDEGSAGLLMERERPLLEFAIVG